MFRMSDYYKEDLEKTEAKLKKDIEEYTEQYSKEEENVKKAILEAGGYYPEYMRKSQSDIKDMAKARSYEWGYTDLKSSLGLAIKKMTEYEDKIDELEKRERELSYADRKLEDREQKLALLEKVLDKHGEFDSTFYAIEKIVSVFDKTALALCKVTPEQIADKMEEWSEEAAYDAADSIADDFFNMSYNELWEAGDYIEKIRDTLDCSDEVHIRNIIKFKSHFEECFDMDAEDIVDMLKDMGVENQKMLTSISDCWNGACQVFKRVPTDKDIKEFTDIFCWHGGMTADNVRVLELKDGWYVIAFDEAISKVKAEQGLSKIDLTLTEDKGSPDEPDGRILRFDCKIDDYDFMASAYIKERKGKLVFEAYNSVKADSDSHFYLHNMEEIMYKAITDNIKNLSPDKEWQKELLDQMKVTDVGQKMGNEKTSEKAEIER